MVEPHLALIDVAEEYLIYLLNNCQFKLEF